MIVNLPTAESLNEVALRLYFSAWSSLIELQFAFDSWFTPEHDKWDQEYVEYELTCQPEIQSICTIIQQSNELALKSKICSISPFLLIRKIEGNLSTTPKDLDFSELQTLDAVELPRAVNTFCRDPLSDEFIRRYHEVRSLRNQIVHLGHTKRQLRVEDLLHILVFQYTELWKGRAWLKDRVHFHSTSGQAWLYDGRYASARDDVLRELAHNFRIFTTLEFKRLFWHPKKAKRYLCHFCIDDAYAKKLDPLDLNTCKTAFLDETGDNIHCVMCEQDFNVSKKQCKMPNCKGCIISDNGDDHVGKCHVCGE